MGAIITKSYVWTSTGTKPTKGDEIYGAGDQPIAEYDNWAMYAITDDIQSINNVLGNHSQLHESGGADEVNLAGMEIGTTAKITEPVSGVIDIQDINGNSKASLDINGNNWTTFPNIDDEVTFKSGLNIIGSESINIPSDSGSTMLTNMDVTGAPVSGTEESYSFAVDGISLLRLYSEADGNGTIQNQEVRSLAPLNTSGNDLLDGTTTIWDTQNSYVPQSSVGGPPGSLSSYPLANSDLANSSVTIMSGTQLTGGGTVSLGGSVSLDVTQGAGSGLDADTVDGLEASDLEVDIEEGGTTVVSNSTGINFTGHINVTDDTDGTVTVDPTHNHDSNDLTDVSPDSTSDAHHSKTTSANDLTDVSPDSTSGAHHTRYSDEEAQDAVGTIVNDGLQYDDANNLVNVLAGNALTIDTNGNIDVVESNISHDNIAGVSSSDHHTRYSDSEAKSAVTGSNHDHDDRYANTDSGGTEHPSYETLSDVPTTVTAGDVVYIEAEDRLYIEDGT